MPVLPLMVAAAQLSDALPACRTMHLSLVADSRDGEYDGMSHSGVVLVIRNHGPDCTVPALPTIAMRDRNGRLLPAARQPPVGEHPGPSMAPVDLARGHQAEIVLRWVSGAVFTPGHSVNAATVSVRIGSGMLRAPLGAVLYGPAGEPVTFEQAPAQPWEAVAD